MAPQTMDPASWAPTASSGQTGPVDVGVRRGLDRHAFYHFPNTPALGVDDGHGWVKASGDESASDAETDGDGATSGSASDADSDGPLRMVRRPTLSKAYTDTEERAVLRKLDRKLVLFLALLYLLSFLDRSNIGNARIAGLERSLALDSSQFDLCLVAFYVTYIAFEWMILLYRLIPAHVYIALCVCSWGLIASLQSVVTSFRQLLTLRACLGVTEAAFGPGVPFYMTFFYRRSELAYRVGLQISAAPLATSFASSLAWVIVQLASHTALEPWRALFLFEGFPSIITAVLAYHFIPDTPATARFLTPRERKVASLRLQHETITDRHDHRSRGEVSTSLSKQYSSSSLTRTSISSKLNMHDLTTTFRDPKSWLQALIFLSVNVSFASLPVFLPTIIRSMSFSPLTSQILAAPPYLFAFAFVLLIGRLSDRIPDSRGLFLAGCAGLAATSYLAIALAGVWHPVLGDAVSVVIRYVAIYTAAMGLFASVVLTITWTLNNQQSATSKGTGMVILNVVGQCGPLIGVKLFPESQKPFYVPGMSVCALFMGGIVVLALSLRVYLTRLNSSNERAGRGTYEMVPVLRDGGDHDQTGIGGRDVRAGGASGSGTRDRFRYML